MPKKGENIYKRKDGNLILCVISQNGSPPCSAIITDSSTIPYDKTYAVL